MLALGRKYREGPILIGTLAKEESIPIKFLEAILLDMKGRGAAGQQDGPQRRIFPEPAAVCRHDRLDYSHHRGAAGAPAVRERNRVQAVRGMRGRGELRHPDYHAASSRRHVGRSRPDYPGRPDQDRWIRGSWSESIREPDVSHLSSRPAPRRVPSPSPRWREIARIDFRRAQASMFVRSRGAQKFGKLRGIEEKAETVPRPVRLAPPERPEPGPLRRAHQRRQHHVVEDHAASVRAEMR